MIMGDFALPDWISTWSIRWEHLPFTSSALRLQQLYISSWHFVTFRQLRVPSCPQRTKNRGSAWRVAQVRMGFPRKGNGFGHEYWYVNFNPYPTTGFAGYFFCWEASSRVEIEIVPDVQRFRNIGISTLSSFQYHHLLSFDNIVL